MGFVLAELAVNRNVEISQLTELRGQLLELWKQDYLTLALYLTLDIEQAASPSGGHPGNLPLIHL